MNEASVWLKAYGYKANDREILLNKLVRELHPGAPEILQEHFNALIGKKGKATVMGAGGAELVLTRAEKMHEDRMHYQIFVVFPLSDYGLAEYDHIAASLAHSAPVAAAVESIRREEAMLPPLLASLPLDPALSNSNPPPASEKPRTLRQAFMDGWNGTSSTS